MKIKNLTCSLALIALAAFAATANAQTTGAAATLAMTATVQDSMQLIISTHAGPTGATVDGIVDDFAVDFGSVNGLGLGTPSSGVAVAANPVGAVYSTPINLTPTYSGFNSNQSAFVTVRRGNSANDDLALEGSSVADLAGVGATAGDYVILEAPSGSSNTRYVAFFIARSETPGPKVASLIYELTVGR